MSTSGTSGFGQFVPGFEFMQNLARQATGGLAQGVQQAVPQMPSLGNWVAPTFNVEDLEKRIQELKAVHFWLDQNARALSATIQALEVQKMTLSTLQGMNLSMGDVANALKVKATDTMASMAGFAGVGGASTEATEPAPPTQFAGLEIPPRRGAQADTPTPPTAPTPPAPEAATAAAPAASTPGVVDPMQWWGALSQQFQTIAAHAMKDAAGQAALDAGAQMATAFTQEALKTASGVVAQPAAKTAKPVAAAKKAAAKPKAAAAKTTPKPVVKAAAKAAPAKAARKTTGRAR